MIFSFFFFLKKILKIKTLSYCCEYIYKKIIFYLSIFNFEIIKIRNVSNLLFLKQYEKVFIGHIDTVHENFTKWIKHPFKSKILKKNIINRGIIDMKGGFISFIFFSNNNFILTNDEESISMYGIQYVLNVLFYRKKNFYLFIGSEPTSYNIIGDNVKISRRGSFNISLIYIGKQKHVAYIGKNTIKIFLNFFLKIYNKFIFKNENLELNNFFSGLNLLNVIPDKLFLKINYRFINFKNVLFIKKKIIKIFKKKFINFSWCLSGLPFICYKNFFLKKIFNIINIIQNIKTKINFHGGTSDIRYCHYIYYNSNSIELGLINHSIHKVNEFSLYDDLLILSIIFFFFLNGIR